MVIFSNSVLQAKLRYQSVPVQARVSPPCVLTPLPNPSWCDPSFHDHMGPFHPMMGPFYSSEAPPQVGSFRVVCTGSGISIVLIQYISMKLLHIQLISPTTVRIFIFSPSSSSHTRQFYKSLLPHSPDWLYTLLISISCSLYYFSCILMPWVRLKAHSDSAWYCVSATHMSTWYRTASRYLANTCGNTAYPQNVCKYLQENVQIYVIYNGTVQKCMALRGLLCTAAAKVHIVADELMPVLTSYCTCSLNVRQWQWLTAMCYHCTKSLPQHLLALHWRNLR